MALLGGVMGANAAGIGQTIGASSRKSAVVSGKFCKSRGGEWSWYAGDVAITGSFGEDAHHDQEAGGGAGGNVRAGSVDAEGKGDHRGAVRPQLFGFLDQCDEPAAG